MPRTRIVSPEERLNGKAGILTLVKPGQVVYTLVLHRHAQGAWGSISLFIVHQAQDPRPLLDITLLAAQALGENKDRYGGIRRTEGPAILVARLAAEVFGDYHALKQEAIGPKW